MSWDKIDTEKTLMGLDSTNRDNSFWDTIGTQTTTRDTIWDSFHGPSPKITDYKIRLL